MDIVISNQERVLRRVLFLHPTFIKPDGKPSSASYQLKKNDDGTLEDGLSVNIESMTTYEDSIEDVTRFRLFASEVNYIRSIGLDCIYNPLPENNAHSLIVGDIKKPQSRLLAEHSIRVNFPD